MRQKVVLTKNNEFLNVMFRGTPCKLGYVGCAPIKEKMTFITMNTLYTSHDVTAYFKE